MIHHIQRAYLALNLYRQSEIVSALTTTLTLERDDFLPKDYETLALSHFLLYCHRTEFPDLLYRISTNLSRNTKQDRQDDSKVIRGFVDWSETVRRRVSNGFADNSSFVIRRNERVYNVPANQLLKFLIEFILKAIPTVKTLAPGQTEGWMIHLTELAQSVRRIYRNRLRSRLQEVTLPRRVTYKLIRSALTHRNPYYQKIGELGDLYYRLFVLRDPKVLFSVIEQQLLAHQEDDKLYEYVVLFDLLSHLEAVRVANNGRRRMGLIRARYRTVFRYRWSNTKVTVYYQHVPEDLAGHSRYTRLWLNHGRSHASSRIPDIVIRITKILPDGSRKRRFAIIEVKHLEDLKSAAIDVEAYLYEFQDVLQDTPKALLVMWSGPRPTAYDPSWDAWVTDSRSLSSVMKSFVHVLLSQ